MAAIKNLAVLLLFIVLVRGKFIVAKEVSQPLDLRDATFADGGWALATPSCPAGTTSCASGGTESNCCPNEYECQFDINTDQHFCCASGAKCQTTIQNIPICANTSWSLFSQGGLSGYFCCLPGQVGILNDAALHYGSCGDGGLSYPSSKLATSVKVAEPTHAASSAGSSSSSLATGTVPASASSNPPASLASSAVSVLSTSANPQSSSANTQQNSASITQGSQTSAASSSPTKGSSSASSTKLGTGAIVGIAVGGVALAFIVGIIGCMYFRPGRRQNRKEAEATLQRSELEYRPKPAELG